MIIIDLLEVRSKLNQGFTITDIKLRVVIYARVSTEHIEQQKSLENQLEHFKELINNNKNWQYINSYTDNGITGTNDLKREEFIKQIN